MIKLLAAAYEDGYAFVEQETRLFLIRPPYTLTHKIGVAPGIIERAVALHGFVAVDGQFEDWAAVVEFLTKQMIECRRSAGTEKPNPDRIRGLIQRAPEDKAREFLQKVECDLLPQGDWKNGIDILTILLKNEVVQHNPVLLNKCADLIDSCRRFGERRQVERIGWLSQPEVLAQEFPLVMKKDPDRAVELARRVQKDGHLLAVGSG